MPYTHFNYIESIPYEPTHDFLTTGGKPACGADMGSGVITIYQGHTTCARCKEWFKSHPVEADAIESFHQAKERLEKSLDDCHDSYRALSHRGEEKEQAGSWHSRSQMVASFVRLFFNYSIVILGRTAKMGKGEVR